MRNSPQPAIYRPAPRIAALSEWIADPVAAAEFPLATVRFRNDRAAAQVGLDNFDDGEWAAHFGRFAPLAGNLPLPLALRYHGHQFRVYNPELGDGRGFLFAQMLDGADRLMDLGTKGSGQTPWSRQGDGRLTLKGAVREILATEMLEALGVNTSRTFSVVETGEELWRSDEPSPTRSAVLVRLSHGHIRIGTFQRLAALGEADHMAELVEYCLANYPGPAHASATGAALLLNQVVERLADLAASWMVAGFVHGVLNTDNMNISGESFDYGPWRWLPKWEPGFTAAYFDHSGLYAFGRQPEALHWNCGQLAVALRLLSEAPPLIEALERFPDLYRAALGRRFAWRLGLEPAGMEADVALAASAEQRMLKEGLGVDEFFFRERTAKSLGSGHRPVGDDHPYWAEGGPQTMLIDEVEAIWARIAESDDWTALSDKVAALRRMGEAHGAPPTPAGHEKSAVAA
ncbi:protein adenylyltransferase SelO family protein [Novosphingobium tardum]|uniref:Protein nucleotidyltransferase YdiU n=1 Tax=Novosphingobium tardum TaxID=1538021 RepID=A0ABV8RS61_9SPHN